MHRARREEAIQVGARALARERTGQLAPDMDDDTGQQAVADATVVIDATLATLNLTTVP